MATDAGEPMMPSGVEEEANADACACRPTNSGAEAEAASGTDASCAPASNSANPNNTMNVVTPPPSMAIPPGLLPSEEAAETALAWRLRSEAVLAGASAPPPEPEDYVWGDGWRDVAVEEFWSGGSGCDAGSVGGGVGGIGRAGAAARALARHERAGRRRRRHRATAAPTAMSTTTTTTRKRRRGGTVDGNDEGDGEGEEGDGSSSPSSLAVLRSVLASVRRGCGLSFVDLALLQPPQLHQPHHQLQRQHQHPKQLQLQKKQQQQQQQQQPVVEIRGAAGTGKTALVLTMAAHYVAATAVGCYLDADAPQEDEDKAADNDDGGEEEEKEEEEKNGDENEVGEEEEDGGNDAWAAYGLGVAPTTSTSTNSANSNNNSKKRKKKEPTVSASTANANAAPAPAPAVVVLDSDLAVHPTALGAAVRAAVLRRWGETGAARRLLDERRRARKRERARRGADGEEEEDTNEEREDITTAGRSTRTAAADRNEEWRRIQSTIRDALGRIHVVRTSSGEGLFADGIPALESLRRSLDLAAASSSAAAAMAAGSGRASASASAAPPTLLLIDSLTSSDRRNQRLEAVGTGLSGRNEFYRQLQRLRAAHPVAVVATATGAASAVVAGTGADTGIATPWSKMVTARVGLERREATAAATAGEMSGGYEYKALVPCVAGTIDAATPGGGARGGSFVATVPFKIDSSGIWD